MTDSAPELLQFFKALADETRLKIVGLLAQQPASGEQLAAILGLKPATISHHVSMLVHTGLVSASAEGRSRRYELRLDAIHALAQKLLAEETLPQATEGLDLEAYDRKVLKDYSRSDGTLKQLPTQQKKLLVILRHLLKQFEPDRRYPEKEVNQILARFHPDTASLRRAMIDFGLMQRAEGVYWLSPE